MFIRFYSAYLLPRYRLYSALSVFTVILISHLFLRAKKNFMEEKRFSTHARKVYGENAGRLFKTMVRLKGIFIKLGQLLSLRVDVLPDEYIQVLSHLQDKVPPIPFERICRRIEHELEKPLSELFIEFDTQALASASLAQVHKAKLHDGRVVAVKVLYPGIEQLFLTDLNIVRMTARFARFFMRKFNVVTVVDEFQKHVALELDLLSEAKNAKILAAKFIDSPQIVIPEVVDSHTTKGVLTTEFINGVKITHKDEYVSEHITVYDVAFTTVDAYMRQIFKYGFFQADPHPGNLFVIPQTAEDRRQDTENRSQESGDRSQKKENGSQEIEDRIDGMSNGNDKPCAFKIALVDFGLCKELPPHFKGGLMKAGLAILQRDAKMLAGSLVSLGFESWDGREESLHKFCVFVVAHVDDVIYKGRNQLNIAAMLHEILSIAREHPLVRIPSDFIFIGRVFALLVGLGKQLRANLDVASIVMPYVMDAATQ